MNGGVINEITKAIEDEGGISSEIGFDIKIVKGKVGASGKERFVRTERIELFHELLNDIERTLENNKVLKNLNHTFEKGKKTFNDFLKDVPNFTYVKATGWSSFEDFERFKRIMSNFNEIQRLIFASSLQNNPEIIETKEQINDLRKKLKSNVNNHKDLSKLKAIEKNFDKSLEKGAGAVFLDEIFIDRVETFLNTFSPNRLNFRLAPFDIFNDFQILANLKSEYLVNGDFENVIYTYGSRPNIKLSVFGIVTSCPQKEDIRVNLNDEFLGYEESELQDAAAFEKAFRAVFSSFEAFEKFFFVPSYPKISVSPIAIYREVLIK